MGERNSTEGPVVHPKKSQDGIPVERTSHPNTLDGARPFNFSQCDDFSRSNLLMLGDIFPCCPSPSAQDAPVPCSALPPHPFPPVLFSVLTERVFAPDRRERSKRFRPNPSNMSLLSHRQKYAVAIPLFLVIRILLLPKQNSHSCAVFNNYCLI